MLSTKYHPFCFVLNVWTYSSQELRVEDYTANRKGPQAGSSGLFGGGTQTSTAGGFGGFGQNKPAGSFGGKDSSEKKKINGLMQDCSISCVLAIKMQWNLTNYLY